MSIMADWHPAPAANVHLTPDEVHLWRVDLDRLAGPVEHPAAMLSTNERAQGVRFRSARDGRRFMIGRATLRMILGLYLGIEPSRVSFEYGPHGKPALACRGCEAPVSFNVAHAASLALVAATRGREVGVDVEHVRAIPEAERIAAHYFSACERATLAQLPPERRQEAFIACWTLKEAYVKAIGQGLSYPLDRFDVAPAPDRSPVFLRIHGDPAEATQWSLMRLTPAPGFIGALAVRGHGWRLCCWDCPG